MRGGGKGTGQREYKPICPNTGVKIKKEQVLTVLLPYQLFSFTAWCLVVISEGKKKKKRSLELS